MARRGVPKEINWYLREWMDMAFEKQMGMQRRMAEMTGWSIAIMFV